MCKGSYKCLNHLMPTEGWMNDPNGLCYYKNEYHIFFQANLKYPNGGKKEWGHYTTTNFKDYIYHGIAIHADHEYDQDGVYSGSAVVKDEMLYLFYTGNYKLKGNYDYINTGRMSTVMCVSSMDGIHFIDKRVILKNEDYPKECTCHVRDPKIYEENGMYYMVLGARLKNNQGALLIYESKDLDKFTYKQMIKSHNLGYMLECPDLFKLDNSYTLSYSPRGVEEDGENFRNLYSAGYCLGGLDKDTYCEWDKGYDFYAPQTFMDHKNRRILIAWAGLDDERLTIDYPTASEGWMHVLTCPRQLTLKNNRIYQYPVDELLSLASNYEMKKECMDSSFMARIDSINSDFEILISKIFQISYERNIMKFCFIESGHGRAERILHIESIENLLIFMDNSIAEIFINDGEYVFTSRVFSTNHGFKLLKGNLQCEISKLEEFRYEKITSNR